jgi:hypothetical protein
VTVVAAKTEVFDVLAWRQEELERAGYPRLDAIELAQRWDVDLHAAVSLLNDGCSVETALRILR